MSADSKSSIQSAYNFGFKEEKTRSAEWEKEKEKAGLREVKDTKRKKEGARYALCVGDIFFKTTLRCFARAFKKCGDLKF